jgi:glycosyltransferase involved in cell wall biosynthesis
VVAMPGLVDDVYDALFANDFFVSASRREGQSNALLEAMSAGCIPIVYGASGASDVIQHNETGFLLPCSDPATFADAFQRALALSDADRVRMSEAAYASTAATIGVDAIARRSLEATKILIARRAAVGGG